VIGANSSDTVLLVTVAEYLHELVRRMQAMVSAVEELSREAEGPEALDAIGREMIERWRAMLDEVQPPPEMAALHARLEEIANSPVEDAFAEATLLELARRAEEHGFELFPGATAAAMEASLGRKTGSWATRADDWEARLRRSLEADGREDVDEIVERMRALRGE